MKLILIVLSVLVPVGICNGAEYYVSDGIKYFFTYPTVLNWYEAMRYCTYSAMYPVSVHSFEEEQVLLHVINKFKEKNNLTSSTIHFWSSGTDLGHNVNEFFWMATGQPVIYKNWMRTNPRNEGGHAVFKTTTDCLLLNGNHNYQWYDQFCETRYSVICQNKFLVPRRFNEHQCEL